MTPIPAPLQWKRFDCIGLILQWDIQHKHFLVFYRKLFFVFVGMTDPDSFARWECSCSWLCSWFPHDWEHRGLTALTVPYNTFEYAFEWCSLILIWLMYIMLYYMQWLLLFVCKAWEGFPWRGSTSSFIEVPRICWAPAKECKGYPLIKINEKKSNLHYVGTYK